MNLIGRRIGEFDVIRELGRGGMGVVYEAVQTSLGRRVALKVLGPGLGLSSAAVARFRREAAAAARLHHSHIVPVYATGEDGGVHFYAMELVDGPSLDAVIRRTRAGDASDVADAKTEIPADLVATGEYLPTEPARPPTSGGAASSGGHTSSPGWFDQVAEWVADVADALHHAHQGGVTHRDVKPSNLLLAADGRLRVTDFGLARVLDEPGMTMTGEFVGTPAYMSPEQITAGRILVDHRTDVYSLGATLYELLTLRPPFVAEGRDKLPGSPTWTRRDPARPPSGCGSGCSPAATPPPRGPSTGGGWPGRWIPPTAPSPSMPPASPGCPRRPVRRPGRSATDPSPPPSSTTCRPSSGGWWATHSTGRRWTWSPRSGRPAISGCWPTTPWDSPP